jgi:hypothetical protein
MKLSWRSTYRSPNLGGKRETVMAKIRYTISTSTPTNRAERPAAGHQERGYRRMSESCVGTDRSRGQNSAIMHRVYPTANRT